MYRRYIKKYNLKPCVVWLGNVKNLDTTKLAHSKKLQRYSHKLHTNESNRTHSKLHDRKNDSVVNSSSNNRAKNRSIDKHLECNKSEKTQVKNKVSEESVKSGYITDESNIRISSKTEDELANVFSSKDEVEDEYYIEETLCIPGKTSATNEKALDIFGNRFGQQYKCTECKESFNDSFKLERHSMVHKMKLDVLYICNDCHLNFKTKLNLTAHKFICPASKSSNKKMTPKDSSNTGGEPPTDPLFLKEHTNDKHIASLLNTSTLDSEVTDLKTDELLFCTQSTNQPTPEDICHTHNNDDEEDIMIKTNDSDVYKSILYKDNNHNKTECDLNLAKSNEENKNPSVMLTNGNKVPIIPKVSIHLSQQNVKVMDMLRCDICDDVFEDYETFLEHEAFHKEIETSREDHKLNSTPTRQSPNMPDLFEIAISEPEKKNPCKQVNSSGVSKQQNPPQQAAPVNHINIGVNLPNPLLNVGTNKSTPDKNMLNTVPAQNLASVFNTNFNAPNIEPPMLYPLQKQNSSQPTDSSNNSLNASNGSNNITEMNEMVTGVAVQGLFANETSTPFFNSDVTSLADPCQLSKPTSKSTVELEQPKETGNIVSTIAKPNIQTNQYIHTSKNNIFGGCEPLILNKVPKTSKANTNIWTNKPLVQTSASGSRRTVIFQIEKLASNDDHTKQDLSSTPNQPTTNQIHPKVVEQSINVDQTGNLNHQISPESNTKINKPVNADQVHSVNNAGITKFPHISTVLSLIDSKICDSATTNMPYLRGKVINEPEKKNSWNQINFSGVLKQQNPQQPALLNDVHIAGNLPKPLLNIDRNKSSTPDENVLHTGSTENLASMSIAGCSALITQNPMLYELISQNSSKQTDSSNNFTNASNSRSSTSDVKQTSLPFTISDVWSVADPSQPSNRSFTDKSTMKLQQSSETVFTNVMPNRQTRECFEKTKTNILGERQQLAFNKLQCKIIKVSIKQPLALSTDTRKKLITFHENKLAANDDPSKKEFGSTTNQPTSSQIHHELVNKSITVNQTKKLCQTRISRMKSETVRGQPETTLNCVESNQPIHTKFNEKIVANRELRTNKNETSKNIAFATSNFKRNLSLPNRQSFLSSFEEFVRRPSKSVPVYLPTPPKIHVTNTSEVLPQQEPINTVEADSQSANKE